MLSINILEEDKAVRTKTIIPTTTKTKSKHNIIAAPFKNDIGEQNCYVNVIIHTLHYIPEIFEYMNKEAIGTINNANEHRLLIELYCLLKKYNELIGSTVSTNDNAEDNKYLNVYALRKELETLFKGEELFKLGLTGDPIDLLFTFLNAFHSYSIKANSLKYCVDSECKPLCPSHELFSLHLVQQYECSNCKGASTLLKYDYNYFIYEIPMKEIILQVDSMSKLDMFQLKLFQYAKDNSAKTASGCPSRCTKPKVKNNIILLSPNPYLCFSVSWKEINPKLTDICKMFFMIPLKVNNANIFEVYDKDLSKSYDLTGLICYWGGHYFCFFKSLEKEEGQRYWIYHDDRTITKVKSWKDIIIQCIKSHYHPIMLLYADSGSRSSFFEDSTVNLNESDYDLILSHCEKIENDTQGQGGPESPSSRIRPVLDLKKSNDIELQKAIASLQKIEEMKLKKSQKDKERCIGDEEGEGDEESKVIPIDEEELSLDQSNWKCTYNKCNNYNNYATFQCIKCKTINLKVFQIIQSTKGVKGFMKINTESKASKYEVLNKSIEKKMSSLLKSNASLHSSPNNNHKTNTGLQYNPELIYAINANANTTTTMKSKKKNPQDWECPYCLSINEEQVYCNVCKRNRPIDNLIITKENTINSIKHYL